MNKAKLILPLLVAPILFGCNKGVVGNYVVDEKNITYIFSEGVEDQYNSKSDKTIYLPINEIKQKIHKVLISYSDGSRTSDGAVHLTNEFPLQRKTKSGESVETRAANIKEEGESSASIGFEWGKDKTGYHFYDNYTEYVDNLRVYAKTAGEGAYTQHVWIGDSGFIVNGNTLTAHFAAEFSSNEEKKLDFKIDFTVTAKK